MAAEDGSNGEWCDEIEGRSSIFIAPPFRDLVGPKGWKALKIQRFVIFPTTLMFLIANDKILCYKLYL